MDDNAPDKSNEVLLGNENCVVRPPMPVHLQKGWNKVFMKLPVRKVHRAGNPLAEVDVHIRICHTGW